MRQPLGQNFLVNKQIAAQIVEAAELSPEDTVVEIGPGRGVLTSLIAPQVKELVAVELDRKLAAELQQKFADSPTVRIVNENFLSYTLPAAPRPLKFIANLPYYVSTAILEKILPGSNWQLAVVMVQKEVGERITAPCGGREYGYFSLFCQYFSTPEIVLKVGPGNFAPPPNVDSVVVRLINKFPPPPDEALFPVIKHAFQQRRKTILNSLSNTFQCPKETVLSALKEAGIEPSLRPEKLTLSCYERLTTYLKNGIIYRNKA